MNRAYGTRFRCRAAVVALLAVLVVGCGNSMTGGAMPTSIPSPDATPTAQPTTSPTTTATANPSDPWAALLARPLHLPTVAPGAPCPATAGQAISASGYTLIYGAGPAYIAVGDVSGVVRYSATSPLDSGSPWGLTEIRWEVQPPFTGALLIRGGKLDDSQALGFNGGAEYTPSNPTGTEPIAAALRLAVTQPGNNQWYRAASYMRLQGPGCYGLQFDGASFSNVVVFQATASP
jgi:hypothetical protein